MRAYLAALPPWLGGKRKIARQIMQVIAQERETQEPGVLADAFMGGGAVSLAAKALGWEVHANDMSPISESIGRSLVANRRTLLRDSDVALAATWEPDAIPPERELSLPPNCRELLARMVGYERQLGDADVRPLVRAWIAKSAISMATWGVPTMAAGRRAWDELTPGQAQQLQRTGRPIKLVRKMAQSLNAGVFDNGRENTMTRGDAVAFIADAQADVLYLDPPYPGTLSYEEVYVGVNRLLEPGAPNEPSEWSAEDGWKLLADVFDAAAHIPLWVVSMGQGADPEAITAMMDERGHEAKWRTLEHMHIQALKKEHTEGGDELLIVGRAR